MQIKEILKLLYIMVLISGLAIGCSQTINPDTNDGEWVRQTSDTSQRLPASTLEEIFPYPVYMDQVFTLFTLNGIEAFYKMNKRVPLTFDEYLNSGIPMLIPNDYVTGKTYHRVEKVDISDTSGFTYKAIGPASCQFEFVIQNDKTLKNQVFTRDITPESLSSFIESTGKPYDDNNFRFTFDGVKRDYCHQFFAGYSHIYLVKNSNQIPVDISELLKNEGQPVKSGWQWSPVQTKDVYFEFGINKSNLSYYAVLGGMESVSEEQLMDRIIQIQKTYSRNKGGRELRGGASLMPDLSSRIKLIDTTDFYNGYEQLSEN